MFAQNVGTPVSYGRPHFAVQFRDLFFTASDTELSIGDRFILIELALLNVEAVGYNGGVCTITDPAGERLRVVTWSLLGGTISTQFLNTPVTNKTFTIVGAREGLPMPTEPAGLSKTATRQERACSTWPSKQLTGAAVHEPTALVTLLTRKEGKPPSSPHAPCSYVWGYSPSKLPALLAVICHWFKRKQAFLPQRQPQGRSKAPPTV